MKRTKRIVVGLFILVLSLALLIWAFRPLDRITRTQPVSPQDLTLPTPISLQTQPEVVS